jgi:hypothetical protein
MTEERDNTDQHFLRYDNLINTPLDGGKSLVDMTAYQGTPLWSVVDLTFYRAVSTIIREGVRKPIRRRLPLSACTPLRFLLDMGRALLVRGIAPFGESWKDTREPGRATIVFTAQDLQWRRIKDYETKKMKKSDAFFDPIIKKLREDSYTVIGVFPLYLSRLSVKTFIDKMRTWDIPHRPFNRYWSLHAWKKEMESLHWFRTIWQSVEKDEKFKELCSYNGKTLYPLIETELKYYFYVVFPRVVKYIEMGKTMIDTENPDVILMLNEYGTFQKPLLIAGKQKRVPVLAVQHGIITPTHWGYIFGPHEKKRAVLPDITCVYGQYHYDLLTTHSIYEPDTVVVTGQPRYDILYYADTVYSREAFFDKYDINPQHAVVLWVTQCHALSTRENIENFEAVFGALQSMEDVTLLIKQHPGEQATHTQMIHHWLAKYDITAVITPKISDTFEQLYVCDVMITKNSTTAMEAVALDTPVVVLNLSGEPDVVNYVAERVAVGVYKKEDLQPVLENVLKNRGASTQYGKEYIEKYLYRIDGKASERVVNHIEKLVLKRRTP